MKSDERTRSECEGNRMLVIRFLHRTRLGKVSAQHHKSCSTRHPDGRDRGGADKMYLTRLICTVQVPT
jgi:hypothetical protein